MLGPEGCAVKAQTTRQGPQVRRDGADDRSRRRRCRDGANKPFSLSLSLALSLLVRGLSSPLQSGIASEGSRRARLSDGWLSDAVGILDLGLERF